MVGTRRRSSILPEPVLDTATPTKRGAAAVSAEKVDTPRKSRRLSEVIVEDAKPTRTSARGGKVETPESVSKLVSKVIIEIKFFNKIYLQDLSRPSSSSSKYGFLK